MIKTSGEVPFRLTSHLNSIAADWGPLKHELKAQSVLSDVVFTSLSSSCLAK